MLRRSFRFGILLGLLGGVMAAAFKAFQSSRPAPLPAATTWTPIPDAEPLRVPPTPAATAAPAPAPTEPVAAAPKADTSALAALQEEPPAKRAPAAKKAAEPKPKPPAKEKAKKVTEPWVQPVDGGCPGTHPVKGKLSSKIFHVPGGFNYARTQPDRCYIDAAAAEADGLRQSKR